MTHDKPLSGITLGGLIAFFGLMMVLWPKRGIVPHPLSFPPSTMQPDHLPYVPFAYPLLVVGVLVIIYSAIFDRKARK